MSSVLLSNKTVMNKYLWMSRHLRNFNDAGSIINWANAMLLVKSLLIDPLPTRSHLERSITPPSTICFQPSEKKTLKKSPSYCSSFGPTEPTHPTSLYCFEQAPSLRPFSLVKSMRLADYRLKLGLCDLSFDASKSMRLFLSWLKIYTTFSELTRSMQLIFYVSYRLPSMQPYHLRSLYD